MDAAQEVQFVDNGSARFAGRNSLPAPVVAGVISGIVKPSTHRPAVMRRVAARDGVGLVRISTASPSTRRNQSQVARLA